MSRDFFSEQREQSVPKSVIVSKYFGAWSNVIVAQPRVTRLAYVDLFAGKGVYDDGSPSTPILILQKALANEKLRGMLTTWFNDANPIYAESLRQAISRLDDVELLRYKPSVTTHRVGTAMAQAIHQLRMIPSLVFVDPCGYKGLSLALIAAFLKDWGSDCIFFFNYNRVNMGLGNPQVHDHIADLFGEQRAAELVKKVAALAPPDREKVVMNEFAAALSENRGKYVQLFRFLDTHGSRTSHYLIFVSKHPLGHSIMKEIMAKESSSREDGVASFEYTVVHDRQLKLLYDYARPLDELGDMLCATFAGRRLKMIEVYEAHNIGTRFVKANYKDALKRLEAEGRIAATPSASDRRAGTFRDDVVVRFPRCKE